MALTDKLSNLTPINQSLLLEANVEKTFTVTGLQHFNLKLVIGWSSGIIHISDLYRERNGTSINVVVNGNVAVSISIDNYNTATIKITPPSANMAYLTGYGYN